MLLVSMDNIGIATIQRGDQSRGMQILGVDAAGGQGGADTAPAPSKSKGKVVRTVHSDDEVLSGDDILLRRRLRASGSSGTVAGRPPIMEHQAPVVATVPPLNPSVAMSPAMALGGTGGSSVTVDSAVVESATTEKEVVVDETVAKRVVNNAAAAKEAANDTTATRKAADDAAAAKEAVDNTTAEERAADDAAAMKKDVEDAAAAKRCGSRQEGHEYGCRGEGCERRGSDGGDYRGGSLPGCG
jgi:hypothetical protein